ncbi:MAG TPA: methyltransferase domain-containing protein [Herpetosiphonaceae bacterium]
MTQQESVFAQEVGAGLDKHALPAYAPMLAAYHRACAAELRAIVGELPLREGDRVLDMACGDGVYSVWLAEHVGADGRVIGVDIAPAYIEAARERVRSSAVAGRIGFEVGSIDGLPFPDDQFDLVWCAHSLYSLPDPVAALREMRRVVRPGGTVAILENDSVHHLLLPWPAELELTVRKAQLEALEAQTQMTGKFYIGRNLCSTFDMAELARCSIKTYTINRGAPLSDDERTFLQGYLTDLRQRAERYLEPAAREAFDMLIDPRSEVYLLDRPDFFMSVLEIVACGKKV